jgi:NB-ARC domain
MMVFDNVEDPELLQHFWPDAKRNIILATTQNPNSTFGLTCAEIEVLPFLPDEGYDFLQKLLRLDPKRDRSAATELVTLLDGLPLGINQMAALMRSERKSPNAFLPYYQINENDLYSETKTGATHSSYKKSVNTVWALSFASLNQDSKSF